MLTPEGVQTTFNTFEQDPQLYEGRNFPKRAEALDYIALVYQVLQFRRHDKRWGQHRHTLWQQAKQLEQHFKEINTQYFYQLQAQIRNGEIDRQALRKLFANYTDYDSTASDQVYMGYDDLDLLIEGLIEANFIPEATKSRTDEMVHYEPTPVRAVLDMVDHGGFNANDYFYDLGSGLGQVTILVRLLTDASVAGIEIEPAYNDHARMAAKTLRLTDIQFITQDARDVDYSQGTIFFMFTPFTDHILASVLASLEARAKEQTIKLCTYGTCSLEIAPQPWLSLIHPSDINIHKLIIFESV